ncbi:MAG: YbaN family protein [Bdellovibrionales bacterium]|nr:YbaN family protein [Bdellovibrionales bacterium]
MKRKNPLYIGLGFICVALGVIGIFLPIMPTVPFLLLAAWCFERGSDKLHNWIISHQTFGPPILAWQQHGVIKKRSKVIAVFFITCSFSYVLLYRPIMIPVKILLFIIGISVITFITTRPSQVPDGERNENQ